MPVFKRRIAFEIARGAKAFLNLDAGVTRGMVPDFERISKRLRSRLKQKREQLKVAREQLALNHVEIERLRRLVQEQSLEGEENAELNRQRFEAASGEDIGERNGQGPFSKGSPTLLPRQLQGHYQRVAQPLSRQG